jgi:hypothetical protein
MPRRRDRKKLRDALDNSLDQRIEIVDEHGESNEFGE